MPQRGFTATAQGQLVERSPGVEVFLYSCPEGALLRRIGWITVNGREPPNRAVAPFQGAYYWLLVSQGCGAMRLTLGCCSFAPLGLVDKWKGESGKGKVESGKWKVESGKWKVESGKLRIES